MQPMEELEPWFYTEKLLGPHLPETYADSWDGNLTELERTYADLRKNPLDYLNC